MSSSEQIPVFRYATRYLNEVIQCTEPMTDELAQRIRALHRDITGSTSRLFLLTFAPETRPALRHLALERCWSSLQRFTCTRIIGVGDRMTTRPNHALQRTPLGRFSSVPHAWRFIRFGPARLSFER